MPMSSVPGATFSLPARYRVAAALAAYVERSRPIGIPPNPPAAFAALTAQRGGQEQAPGIEEAILVAEVDGALYVVPRRDGTEAGEQWRTYPDMAPVDPPISGHTVR